MPHDKRGTELAVGDTVMVPCRVKAIHLTEDYCNVDLETKEPMPPVMHTVTLTLNSKQTIKPAAAVLVPAPQPDWKEIQSVEYQARAAAKSRPCGNSPCVEEFPGMPSRWCSGCLIDALLTRLRPAVSPLVPAPEHEDLKADASLPLVPAPEPKIMEHAVKPTMSAAEVLAHPQPFPSLVPAPPEPQQAFTSFMQIEIEREDDGSYFASWTTGNEGGCAAYSTTVVGALAELCATLLKVDEDKAIERAAAARSPTPENVETTFGGPWRSLPVGTWFFLESLECLQHYGVAERTHSGYRTICYASTNSPVDRENMQRIVRAARSPTPAAQAWQPKE